MCSCVLERAARGKAFRLLLEEGNVLLLVAERRYRDFELSVSDGSRIATLHRVSKGHFVLRRAAPCALDPELAAIVLGDREVRNAPSRPRLNHMRIAAVRPAPTLAELMDRVSISATTGIHGAGRHAAGARAGGVPSSSAAGLGSSGATAVPSVGGAHAGGDGSVGVTFPFPSPQYTKALGRPAGELLAALGPTAATPPPASLLLLESRLPVWDENAQLLTLDYPPGRANLASVQNFQLLADTPPTAPEQPEQPRDISDGGGGGSAGGPQAEADDAAFSAALVHGLMHETDALETFSLDLRHPLSPLLAFATCLAAQDWE